MPGSGPHAAFCPGVSPGHPVLKFVARRLVVGRASRARQALGPGLEGMQGKAGTSSTASRSGTPGKAMGLQTTARSHARCRGVPSPQPFPKSSLKGLHCDVGDVIQKSNSDVQWLHQLYIRWPGVLLLCELLLPRNHHFDLPRGCGAAVHEKPPLLGFTPCLPGNARRGNGYVRSQPSNAHQCLMLRAFAGLQR